MGQFLSSLSAAISLGVPLALSFLLPWTVSPPRPSIDNSSKPESTEGETTGRGRSSSGSSSSIIKEGRNGSGSGSKKKASVSMGTTPSKRQHLPRRKASILIHAATEDEVTSTELSSSSSASSDSEGPEQACQLTPLPPPVARPRPIPNSYWATPLLLACEYPWCPRTANASGTERPPKLDALLKAGVRCFVDLTEPGELTPYHVESSSSSKSASGMSTPTTESKQTASVLLQRCAVLGIPAEEVSYYRFPIQDRSLPPIISASSSTSSNSSSSSSSDSTPSPPSPTASSKCPLISRALALLSANAAQGKITAVHCRGGIGRTGVVVGCFLIHSGYISSGATEGDEAGENALRLIEREWKGVAKSNRYPQSPETGPQVEYVRHYRKEAPSLGGVGEKMRSGTGARKATSVAVQFETGSDDATRMITTTTKRRSSIVTSEKC
ncbi:hypothetical protein D9619_003796 [Psilocybe cf. subviscida]|uniref:Tyrosine specific protein phosphatases domain-containing protein n=1 Tax=Psilocybe cf. subviscida TaxID=2480587 RepID=A0A8H5AXF0_9AGAR|nr:hypothetical protein D9619_003796 [Psilocybe cf. subviscida]